MEAESDSKQTLLSIKDALSNLGIDTSENKSDSGTYDRYVKASRLAARALGVKGGEVGVVINARVSTLACPSNFWC